MRRYKHCENGYVYDRRLLWICLAPFFILFAITSYHTVTADYNFYMECRGVGMTCENPYYGDCPSIIERQAPRICEQKYLQVGNYGQEPSWTFNWLFPVGVGGLLIFLFLNHRRNNGGFEDG